jgi:Uma2 family endonuclease
MASMTTIEVAADFRADDLDQLPDDGNRYELIDGLLLVSPEQAERHQRVVVSVLTVLSSRRPAGLRPYVAPLDVRLSDRVQVQPDLVVVTDGPVREKLDRVPVLCVEVLSPSTRRHDLVLKRRAFEAAGIPSYWIIDPIVPSLTVLELRQGLFVETAMVVGDQPWTATHPFEVTIVPSALLR